MTAQVIREADRRGAPIPPPWDDPPKVPEGLQVFMLCFNDLNSERDYYPEFVPKIKKSAVLVWAEHHGFAADTDFMEDLYFFVKELDDAWIPLEVDRRKKLARKNGKGKGNDTKQHGEEAASPRRQYSRSEQFAKASAGTRDSQSSRGRHTR